MRDSFIRDTVRASVALAAVAAISAAQAAPYVATFDPIYGSPFTNPLVGWRGLSNLDIDDNCFNNSTPGLITLGSVSGCSGTVLSTTVGFYDFNEGGQPTRSQASFSTPYAITRLFYSGSIANNDLLVLGIDAPITSYVTPVETNPGDNVFLFGANIPNFALEFNLGALAAPQDGPYNGPLVYWDRGEGCVDLPGQPCKGANSEPPSIYRITGRTSTTVPEPAGVGLVLAALAAAAVATRRRRGAA
jgi:hypothetical protein